MNSRSIIRPGRRFCWLSGLTESARPDGWWAPWFLHVAHIASGAGVARRVDDARAVILLCPLAHQCHVSNSNLLTSMSINGVEWPTIDERHTLWLKKQLDPDNYDESYLQTIWISALPTPERPPEAWMRMLHRNTGILI